MQKFKVEVERQLKICRKLKLKVNSRFADNEATSPWESLTTSFKSHHGILVLYGEVIFAALAAM